MRYTVATDNHYRSSSTAPPSTNTCTGCRDTIVTKSSARRARCIGRHRSRGLIRRALAFIACTGSATDLDRWERSTGINPFTLALCTAALVAGAGLLPSPSSDWAL
jgi:hypothetical protein